MYTWIGRDKIGHRQIPCTASVPAPRGPHVGRLFTAEAFEQSNVLYEQALAIDPEYPAARTGLAKSYINLPGNGLLPWDEGYAKAREATEKALAIDPDYAYAHAIIGNAAALLFYLGRLDEAVAAYETGLESFTREEGYEVLRVLGQAIALYALGHQEEHQAKLNKLIERWGDERPSQVAQVYAFMGDTDRAFEWLQKSVDEEEEGGFGPTGPLLQPLANDPRWLPMVGPAQPRGLRARGADQQVCRGPPK